MAKYEELNNKRVIVTGGASGIGLATAKRFANEGSKVIIFDINEKAIKSALLEEPRLSGGKVVDVSNEENVEDGFKYADEVIGGIDILISNAGISVRKPFRDVNYKQWKKVIDVNLNGMFLCANAAVKRMEAQNSGVILFTASTNGMSGHPNYTDYNASKAGVILLGKSLALEFAPNIRVNSICPGYVMTPMQKSEYTEEMFVEVNKGIPLKRHAEPEEIAALYAFLASDEASYITGQAIPIDGGETA